MSVSFLTYVVDIQDLKSLIDSHDLSRIDLILQKIGDHFLFRNRNQEVLRCTLQSFLDGNVHSLDKEQVVTALLALCTALGTLQDCDLVCGVDSDLLDELGQGADPLFNRGSPFPIGTFTLINDGDGLGMGYLWNAEIPSLLEENQAMYDEFPAGGDPDVMETIETVGGWYAYALKENKDLLGFWY